jgi:hypothetical protein
MRSRGTQPGYVDDLLLEALDSRGAPLVLLGQASQLLAQHGGLPLGDSRVGPQHPLREPVVARLLAPAVHQRLEALLVGSIAAGNEPSLSCSHQLGRLHREGAKVSDRAGTPTSPAGSVGVSAILDEEKTATLRQLPEAVQIRHRAGQVNRHDGLGAPADRRLDPIRIEAVRLGENVHEDGYTARRNDRAGSPDEGVGAGDDLGAGREASRLERQCEGDGAIQSRHRVGGSHVRGEFSAERPCLVVRGGMASPILRFEHPLESGPLRLAELGPARPGTRPHRTAPVNRQLLRQTRDLPTPCYC